MKSAIFGAILLAGTVANADIIHDETMVSPKLISQGSSDFYFVQFHTRIFGAVKATDSIKFEWKAGGKVLASATCTTRTSQDDATVKAVECETPQETKLKAVGAVDATLSLVDGGTSKATPTRVLKLDVKKWALRDGGNVYQVSGDDTLGLAIARDTNLAQGTQTAGEPGITFWTTADARDGDGAKLKCSVGGKALDPFKAATDIAEDSLDVEAIQKTGTYNVKWSRVTLRLNQTTFTGTRPADASKDWRYFGDTPGHWKCDFQVGSKLLRQFEFDIDDKGHFVNDALNTGKGAIALPPHMAVVGMTIPKGVELRVRPAALKASMGFGLPWPDNAKAKAAVAALPPQVGADK